MGRFATYIFLACTFRPLAGRRSSEDLSLSTSSLLCTDKEQQAALLELVRNGMSLERIETRTVIREEMKASVSEEIEAMKVSFSEGIASLKHELASLALERSEHQKSMAAVSDEIASLKSEVAALRQKHEQPWFSQGSTKGNTSVVTIPATGKLSASSQQRLMQEYNKPSRPPSRMNSPRARIQRFQKAIKVVQLETTLWETFREQTWQRVDNDDSNSVAEVVGGIGFHMSNFFDQYVLNVVDNIVKSAQGIMKNAMIQIQSALNNIREAGMNLVNMVKQAVGGFGAWIKQILSNVVQYAMKGAQELLYSGLANKMANVIAEYGVRWLGGRLGSVVSGLIGSCGIPGAGFLGIIASEFINKFVTLVGFSQVPTLQKLLKSLVAWTSQTLLLPAMGKIFEFIKGMGEVFWDATLGKLIEKVSQWFAAKFNIKRNKVKTSLVQGNSSIMNMNSSMGTGYQQPLTPVDHELSFEWGDRAASELKDLITSTVMSEKKAFEVSANTSAFMEEYITRSASSMLQDTPLIGQPMVPSLDASDDGLTHKAPDGMEHAIKIHQTPNEESGANAQEIQQHMQAETISLVSDSSSLM